MDTSALAKRMKKYEAVSKNVLISSLEINQKELLKQPLRTIGTLLKHSKNIMRIFLMAN